MSISAITWAYDQAIKNPQAKFVLVTLANHADKGGACFPGIDTLSRKTGMHRSTVIRHIGTLINEKFISKVVRSGDGSGRKSNLYQLNLGVDNIGKVADCDIGQCRTVQRQSRILQGQCRTVRPEPSVEPSVEPPDKKTTKKDPDFTPPPEVNLQAWSDLDQYRSTHKVKKVRDTWSSLAKAKACNLLSPLSHEDQMHCVDMTIANGWQGIFPDKLRSTSNGTQTHQPTHAARRRQLHHETYEQMYNEACSAESEVDCSDI
ncbi:MAG: helix-turn-helix domain-containing protein [Candidatus Thiodiazotropha lotti]|uniref:Helix-turn-helix domain-containing protein n=1 Tax=Candidatus Thiodiazotropha lotti TaxID=2792787 RepID=A0A9E4K2P9_9GAMM|nr:helix-turn-helix domain-containing protein [Candidatus Thiodiazotropha lotti]MCG7937959.1 helix-turn-helix domain-containing protein [Candidatus Thiodiazotropha lotti]MCW4202427.1 helix-turn-helix domain-containing protein [Candidatus Thiodiazotropha lotti]MCW4222597.1 helix-turn-helix domain-containing protein [Candidatus Thiodiazotropha lotti]